jgi:hypothetical protein
MHNNTGNILQVRLLFRDTFCLVPYIPLSSTPPPPPPETQGWFGQYPIPGGGGEGVRG